MSVRSTITTIKRELVLAQRKLGIIDEIKLAFRHGGGLFVVLNPLRLESVLSLVRV